MATLSIKVSKTESIDFPIEKKSTIIGRSADCDLVIDNSYISSQHAVVHRSDDNTFIIEDRDSTHGVTVNGVKIIAEKLKHGDSIRLGQLDIIFTSIAGVSQAGHQSSQPAAPALNAPVLRRRPAAPGPQSAGDNESETSKLRTSAANATPTPLVRPTTAAAASNTATETISATAVASGPLATPLGRARKTATVRSGLPVPKTEQGPRNSSQISAIPDTFGNSEQLESEIDQMKQTLAELQQKETTSRRNYDDAMEEMRTNVADLTKKRRKLREELDDLSDRHRTINARIDDEDDAFLPVVYEVVKRVDLLENLIESAKSSKKVTNDFVEQLETLNKSFADLYERHNIKQESIEPGTALNMMLRRRIKIVDESGKEDIEANKADQPKTPSQPKVLKTVRPGIIYSPTGGAEAILRKVEVIVEHS